MMSSRGRKGILIGIHINICAADDEPAFRVRLVGVRDMRLAELERAARPCACELNSRLPTLRFSEFTPHLVHLKE